MARQHFETFKKRFSGLPINIVELSRLTKNKKEVIEKINDVLTSNMRSGELVTGGRESLEKSRKSAGKYELWFDEGSGI